VKREAQTTEYAPVSRKRDDASRDTRYASRFTRYHPFGWHGEIRNAKVISET